MMYLYLLIYTLQRLIEPLRPDSNVQRVRRVVEFRQAAAQRA